MTDCPPSYNTSIRRLSRSDDRPFRLIARLDIKNENLIKGIQLEGLRQIGDPAEHAERYYLQGADEILYMDIVASLYGRTHLPEIIKQTASRVFVPLTVGGGVRTVDDVAALLRAGADKVAINTAAVQRHDLLQEVSRTFGSQCLVLSIEAKRGNAGSWQAYTESGREPSGLDVVKWAKKGVELGAGEILLTSIDREGTQSGFDNELVAEIAEAVSVPVIASGGYGSPQHLLDLMETKVDAVAFAATLHYNKSTINELRSVAQRATNR